MEKLAIIDMGSNSIRFVVIQIADNNSYSMLYQQKESIRLGEGLSVSGCLSADGMERAHPHFVNLGDTERADTLFHFPCGFIRKSKRENAIRFCSCVLQDISNAVDDCARFAASGSGQNERMLGWQGYRGKLRWIEIGEDVGHQTGFSGKAV